MTIQTNEQSLMDRCQKQRDEIRLLRLMLAVLVSRSDGTVTIDMANEGNKEVYIREPRGGFWVLDSTR